jgi:hypothetical protein
VEGSAPSETKEEPTSSFRVGDIDVRALTTLGTSGRTKRRKIMVIYLDRLEPYQGAARDERP